MWGCHFESFTTNSEGQICYNDREVRYVMFMGCLVWQNNVKDSTFFLLDDGTGIIKCKYFIRAPTTPGNRARMLPPVGSTIQLTGTLREYRNTIEVNVRQFQEVVDEMEILFYQSQTLQLHSTIYRILFGPPEVGGAKKLSPLKTPDITAMYRQRTFREFIVTISGRLVIFLRNYVETERKFEISENEILQDAELIKFVQSIQGFYKKVLLTEHEILAKAIQHLALTQLLAWKESREIIDHGTRVEDVYTISSEIVALKHQVFSLFKEKAHSQSYEDVFKSLQSESQMSSIVCKEVIWCILKELYDEGAIYQSRSNRFRATS